LSLNISTVSPFIYRNTAIYKSHKQGSIAGFAKAPHKDLIRPILRMQQGQLAVIGPHRWHVVRVNNALQNCIPHGVYFVLGISE
jgi:hypothetical protein